MRSKNTQTFLLIFSLICVFSFAIWWFNPSHLPSNFSGLARIFDVLLFLSVSFVIWHPIIMDVLTWCISSNIKSLKKIKPIPNKKVAFITTIVPKNEPIDLLYQTLPAMINVKYKHDTWVLDEGNNEEVKKICYKFGVYHFSRCGIDKFNTENGKFTKTKAGNHNSWYEIYGSYYDFVAQVDADFVPKKDFLIKTLGYFRDPKVAFVGTPQIYGNTSKSIIALGASEQQNNFYGAVLRGLSSIGMMLLIGANHVIRVSSFKNVGHYTAHITEDLVTGMKLHAEGFKSVYVPFPLAIGQGPSTWESYFNQQLRWAYGCIDILFHYSPKFLRKMNLKNAIYYFLLQQHYFSGLALAISIFLLGLYFIFGFRAANVDIFKFFIIYSLILFIDFLMSVWLQRYDVSHKKEGELMLFGKIISIAAWPVWFLAFLNVLTGKRLIYIVTPKGNKDSRTNPLVFIPHFTFALTAVLGILISNITHRQNVSMIFWAVSCIVFMISIPFINPLNKVYKFIFGVLSNLLINSYSRVRKSEFILQFPQKKELIRDCIFLTIIVIFSVSTYIDKIGFYSDDWSFLGNFTLSQNKSLIGLIQTATTPNTFMRPMQNVYDALLYFIFGINPLGYQIVNSFVFLSIIILLYLVLRRIRMPRIITLTVPLVFSLLPNYSTDRFWYAAFQVNLSIMFFLLSTYAGLKAYSIHTKRMIFWKIVSILSLIISALSYEVILPFVILNLILFWNPLEKFRETISGARNKFQNHAVFIFATFATLIYLLIFKLKTTIRLGSFNYPRDIVTLILAIFHTNFDTLGFNLPRIWGMIISKYSDPQIIIFSVVLYLLVFLYVFLNSSMEILPRFKFFFLTTVSGVFLFFLGYSIFFTNNKVGFSPTGVDNRVAIAASIGIAFTFIGLSGMASRLIRSERYAKFTFSVLVSVICTGGFLVINTLSVFWAGAYSKSTYVLSDIYNKFPKLANNSTIILDGVCPYYGPAVVFESQWDLKGALQIKYQNPTINADIVTPRLKLANKNIQTQIYTFRAAYPYNNIFIYNVKYQKVFQIRNENDAINYFNTYNPNRNNNCPIASAGNGVNVF